jgi:hypothetical protein
MAMNPKETRQGRATESGVRLRRAPILPYELRAKWRRQHEWLTLLVLALLLLATWFQYFGSLDTRQHA